MLQYTAYFPSLLFPLILIAPCTCSILILVIGLYSKVLYDPTTARFMDPAGLMSSMVQRLSFRSDGQTCPPGLTPTKIIYACHPHGIAPVSIFYFMNRCIPVVVDISMLTGWMAPIMLKFIGAIDSSKSTIVKNLSQHGSVALYPGGADEMCMTTNERRSLYVHIRMGIIRLAMEQSGTIVPVWIPAEWSVYTPVFTRWNPFKHWIWKTFRVPIAPHYGHCGLPGIPRALVDDFVVYHGTPIPCSMNDSIESLFDRYKKEIQVLADRTGHCIHFANHQ